MRDKSIEGFINTRGQGLFISLKDLAVGTLYGWKKNEDGVSPVLKPFNKMFGSPQMLDTTITTKDRIYTFSPEPIRLSTGDVFPIPKTITIMYSDINNNSPILDTINNKINSVNVKYEKEYSRLVEENRMLKMKIGDLEKKLEEKKKSLSPEEEYRRRLIRERM